MLNRASRDSHIGSSVAMTVAISPQMSDRITQKVKYPATRRAQLHDSSVWNIKQVVQVQEEDHHEIHILYILDMLCMLPYSTSFLMNSLSEGLLNIRCDEPRKTSGQTLQPKAALLCFLKRTSMYKQDHLLECSQSMLTIVSSVTHLCVSSVTYLLSSKKYTDLSQDGGHNMKPSCRKT